MGDGAVAGAERNVLIVDDVEMIGELLGRLLARSGWSVECVPDGPSAIASIADRGFHAVIMDVRLGTEDGVALADQLCDVRPELTGRIIYMTGAVDAPHGITPGVPLLHKPFTAQRLQEVLAALPGAEDT